MKTNILKNKNYEIEFLRAVSVLFVVFSILTCLI